jgi:hypothetical protein
MPLSNSTVFLFRGTTIGYPGSESARKVPYSCTTTNPIKALLFALECHRKYATQAVVYIADIKNLRHLKPIFNCLENMEEEVGFPIPPSEFYAYCEGHINIADFQMILRNRKMHPPGIVNTGNLSMLCEETPVLTDEEIVCLVNEMYPHLKKNGNL